MPKKMHDKIAKDVRHAHPGYSAARVEQETNAVMSNIGKGYTRRGTGGKMSKSRKPRGKSAWSSQSRRKK